MRISPLHKIDEIIPFGTEEGVYITMINVHMVDDVLVIDLYKNDGDFVMLNLHKDTVIAIMDAAKIPRGDCPKRTTGP